jgi:hypothetical protein
VYLGLLLLALLLFGTTLGNMLLGLVISVHAMAVLDVLFQTPGPVPSRLLLAVLVLGGLTLGIYLPLGWPITRIADTVSITNTMAPFEEDDVVLVNRWAYLRSAPKPGDLVLYEVPAAYITGVNFRGGEAIDRILAGPGTRFVWENGQALVDGVPSPWQPLNAQQTWPRFEVTVPADHYLILPTTFRIGGAPNVVLEGNVLRTLCRVPADRIGGKVYLRLRPLQRFGRLR